MWGIYLVNLLFWSSFAITGPAIAGMMQLTEARWSPTVKRVALSTSGFLPVSLVLFLVLSCSGSGCSIHGLTTPRWSRRRRNG